MVFDGLGEVLDGLGRFLRLAVGLKCSETRFLKMSVFGVLLGVLGSTNRDEQRKR